MQCTAILWREWIFFKSKWISISLSALTGPALYLIAFGWGLGSALEVNGMPYIMFVVPGLMAMSSMTTSFSTIATDINLSRSYQKTFEAVMIAPVSMRVYTFFRVSANVLRCLYSSLLIIIVSCFFNAMPRIDWYFIIVLLLNSYIFSAAGFLAGILIDSHADIAKVSTFIITPMSFLCGTFFPLEKFPQPLRSVLEFLPASQTAKALRMGLYAEGGVTRPLVLAVWAALLLVCAVSFCKKAE